MTSGEERELTSGFQHLKRPRGGVFVEARPAVELELGGVEGRASCTGRDVVGNVGGERGGR